MFGMLKIRNDRRARSEICSECQVPHETARGGESVVRGTRASVSVPARVV